MCIVGRPAGWRPLSHSGSCRCHIVATTGASIGSAKSRNGVGRPSNGWVRVRVACHSGRLAQRLKVAPDK